MTKALRKAAAFQAMKTPNPVLQAAMSRYRQQEGEDDEEEDEDERQEHLEKALKELRKAMDLFDGCVGGDPRHDLITDCDEARTLMHAARQLEQAIEAELAPEPPKMMP